MKRTLYLLCYCLMGALFLTSSMGCRSFRGVMYLQKPRVSEYLVKNAKKPAKGDPKAQKKRRELMTQIPDANRILGGFCTGTKIQSELAELRRLKAPCQKRLKKYEDSAKINGGLYWGFLLGTVATGTGMIVGGLALAPTDPSTAATVAVVFGSGTLLLALINGLGGFDGRQEVAKLRATTYDNYMWTMRLRIISEVCNAKSREVAAFQMTRILRRTKELCLSTHEDDGMYRNEPLTMPKEPTKKPQSSPKTPAGNPTPAPAPSQPDPKQ